ncbi:MAG TPA: hypothetical protein VJ464_15870 [Blastocatellia bacterium]|nr:hypothetical protein [Blastocatellia bacterium]
MKIHLTKQSGISLTDLIERLAAALREQFRRGGEPIYYYPDEVFDDSVIVCDSNEAKKYRIPYTIEGDKVTFGTPVEVREEYVPVDGPQTVEVMQGIGLICQSLDPEGWKWRFQVVAWGLSATRHIWRKEVFAQSLRDYQWENLKAFADHATEDAMRNQPERSIKDLVGWWTNFEITDQGMDATLNIKPSADWLRQDLIAAFKAGNKSFYGASIFVGIQAKQVTWSDQKSATEAEKVKPITIDIVTDAAANGYPKYALASRRARTIEEGANAMNKKILALLFKRNAQGFQLVRQTLVTASTEGVTAETTEDQLAEAIGDNEALVTQAMGLLETQPAAPATAATPTDDEGWAQLPQRVREEMVAQALRGSGLDQAVQQTIAERLGDDATLNDVDREVENARAVLAATTQSGRVDNPRVVTVGANRYDKYAIGVAKAMGMRRAEFDCVESYVERDVRQSTGNRRFTPEQSTWDDVSAIPSLRQLYVELTGDDGLTGRARRSMRMTRQSQSPWLTSDFPDLMSNLMHKQLIAAYREVDWQWRRVVTIKRLTDFKQQQLILLGYFADLPTVSQNGEYTTPAALTDDKEYYSPGKRGLIVELTIEDIANDDLMGLGTRQQRLGRAAARTLAKFVWLTCLFNNPTLNQDGKTMFHADHNNLISDPLGPDGLKNGVTKLLTQTEPGSNEPFMVDPRDLTLALHPTQYLDAIAATDFNQQPGGETSALAQTIRRLGITPVPLPIATDTNDFLLTANPRDIDIVVIGFFMGNEEPEYYSLSGETHEKAMNNDVILRDKIRHIYGGYPVDPRGAVKSSPVGG